MKKTTKIKDFCRFRKPSGFSKRGQIFSLPPVYLLFILFAIAILIFGYKAISSLSKRGEEATFIKFKTQLENDVKSIMYSYGSVKTERYGFPADFKEICFIDLKQIVLDKVDKLVIRDSLVSGIKKNIFLFGKKNYESFYIENLELYYYPYFSCIEPKKGFIELTMKGKGYATVIKTEVEQKDCKNFHDDGACAGLDALFGTGYRSECCEKYKLCC